LTFTTHLLEIQWGCDTFLLSLLGEYGAILSLLMINTVPKLKKKIRFCKKRKFAVSVDGLPSLDKIMDGSQDSQLVTMYEVKQSRYVKQAQT
jgi:hypothetical protein